MSDIEDNDEEPVQRWCLTVVKNIVLLTQRSVALKCLKQTQESMPEANITLNQLVDPTQEGDPFEGLDFEVKPE